MCIIMKIFISTKYHFIISLNKYVINKLFLHFCRKTALRCYAALVSYYRLNLLETRAVVQTCFRVCSSGTFLCDKVKGSVQNCGRTRGERVIRIVVFEGWMERKLALPIKRHANVAMHPVAQSERRNKRAGYRRIVTTRRRHRRRRRRGQQLGKGEGGNASELAKRQGETGERGKKRGKSREVMQPAKQWRRKIGSLAPRRWLAGTRKGGVRRDTGENDCIRRISLIADPGLGLSRLKFNYAILKARRTHANGKTR